MSTSIGPTYDPTTTAAALAEKYTASRQQILTSQTSQAAAASKALATLNSAIKSYQTSLDALTATSKSMLSQTATFADTTVGSAKAGPTATAGSYAFFVQQLATASQVTYAGVPDSPAAAGNLTITVGTTSFTVDLLAAAQGAGDNANLTVRELAAAINANPGNAQLVSASVVTTGAGISQLVLTAKNTGVASSVTLDASSVAPGALRNALMPAAAVPAEVVAGKNAIVRLGSSTGTPIEQATNTFTNVEGVTMTFTRAQAGTENPVTMTVAGDNAGTTANVQAFIDAYNKLKTVVDGMLAAGDPASGAAAGAFSHDSGVKVLQSRLVGILRQAGTSSLAAFGITAGRDGLLTLDTPRLTRQLAVDPTGLDKLIGSSATTPKSGIAGNLDTYLEEWSGLDGQIIKRKDVYDKLQTRLAKRQDLLDSQYDRAYQRYLLQFTQLQALQSQMSSNTSLFDALFGDKSN